jgi:hypothetical protein
MPTKRHHVDKLHQKRILVGIRGLECQWSTGTGLRAHPLGGGELCSTSTVDLGACALEALRPSSRAEWWSWINAQDLAHATKNNG